MGCGRMAIQDSRDRRPYLASPWCAPDISCVYNLYNILVQYMLIIHGAFVLEVCAVYAVNEESPALRARSHLGDLSHIYLCANRPVNKFHCNSIEVVHTWAISARKGMMPKKRCMRFFGTIAARFSLAAIQIAVDNARQTTHSIVRWNSRCNCADSSPSIYVNEAYAALADLQGHFLQQR